MQLDTARYWTHLHASIVQGYYIDGDAGQPDPGTVYCHEHAARVAKRLTRKTRKQHNICEAWAGSDTVERCGVKSCDVTLNTGGLTKEGIRWALGMDEENPISFVATVDELEMVRVAMRGDGSLEVQHLWQLWLSQVLRNQHGVTQKQRLAFEAAWLAEQWEFALDILRQRDVSAPKRRRAA